MSQTIASYKLANKIGLQDSQQQEFIQLLFESQRLEYIRIHLEKLLPVVEAIQRSELFTKNNKIFKEYSGI
ncbi:hypothetical protein [Rhizosphaericola mali]|uniref:Uncharacterized protein n=1 Tax=Rhizosphaericola mali TaxID=2545455 RepID=A0A5P2G232_9BACT|nr:hypothetical protein [Rhizosphaericola mali]QES87153.1 hypothetical protein E0W69_000210 [Rhizosphaericola mali]